MLSDSSRPIIEATLPLVRERLGVITADFYRRLFAAHPELLDGMFNRGNQSSGAQATALAGSIVAFARHLIDEPETLPETMLARVAHRHASLGVREEQYPVVHKHLLAAIAADLEAVITREIATAWSEVYWLMANALLALERGLVSRQANDETWTRWRVASRTPAGDAAMTLALEPVDEVPVTPAEPGQYVSIRLRLADGIRQARQYSLSADAGTKRIITVKREEGGEVSSQLHDTVAVGDTVELSNPYGEIVPDEGTGHIILASAGIGCTPTASILRHLADRGSLRRVDVLHAESTPARWALQEQMRHDVARLPAATMQLWFTEETPGAHHGRMSLETTELHEDTALYLCGPTAFMRAIRSAAIDRGLASTRIHYEVFGPDAWLAS